MTSQHYIARHPCCSCYVGARKPLISKNTVPEHPEETEAFKRIESQVEEMSNMGSTPLQAGTDLEYHIRETCRFVFWTKLEDDFLHRVWEIVSSLFLSVLTILTEKDGVSEPVATPRLLRGQGVKIP